MFNHTITNLVVLTTYDHINVLKIYNHDLFFFYIIVLSLNFDEHRKEHNILHTVQFMLINIIDSKKKFETKTRKVLIYFVVIN